MMATMTGPPIQTKVCTRAGRVSSQPHSFSARNDERLRRVVGVVVDTSAVATLIDLLRPRHCVHRRSRAERSSGACGGSRYLPVINRGVAVEYRVRTGVKLPYVGTGWGLCSRGRPSWRAGQDA